MATFGKTDVGESTGGWDAAYTWVCRYQLTEDGIVTAIDVYNGDVTPTGTVRVAIYNESGGLPNNLVVGPTDAQAAVTGWNSFTGLNVSLSAGYYWIAVYWSEGQSGGRKYDAGDTDQAHIVSGNMPDPYGTPLVSYDDAISMYATYTSAVVARRKLCSKLLVGV